MADIVLVLILILLVGGVWLFQSLDTKVLARGLRYAAVGALVLIGIVLAVSGRAFLDLPIGALIFWLLRGWFTRGFPGVAGLRAWLDGKPRQPATSTVETPWLNMSLDQATGAMDGVVIAGRFQGARLSQLGLEQLLALLAECGTNDPQSGRLIETYLDRTHADWRDRPHAGREEPAKSGVTAMSPVEAWQILGLEPGADEQAIRDAHRNLMMKLHPDHGGNSYLARQINVARDILLGG